MGTTPDYDRIASPLVLHDLPESERCIDTRMRSHRIQDLWQLCAAERDARGRTLPAARQQMLQRHCRTLARLTSKVCLMELEGYDITTVLDHMDESGVVVARQLEAMRAFYEMFLEAAIESEENDVELRRRLDECAGVSCALTELATLTRADPVPLGEALSSGEVFALLWEASGESTGHLLPGFARTLTWFLVVSLCCGVPAASLVEAEVEDVVLDEAGMMLRAGSSKWKIGLVVASIGFLRHLEHLRQIGERRLFPELASVRGRMMLDRFLAGRRVEDSCGRIGGYTLADIRATYERGACVSMAASLIGYRTPVVNALCAIETRVRTFD
jgi:hypothetical protein